MSSNVHQDENETSTIQLLRQIVEQKNKQLNELRVFADLERQSLEAQLQMLETESSRRKELEKENDNSNGDNSVSSNFPGIACTNCASSRLMSDVHKQVRWVDGYMHRMLIELIETYILYPIVLSSFITD